MDIDKLFLDCEESLKDEFAKIDSIKRKNSVKVIEAFINNGVSDGCFNASTGYGYDDMGRDVIERVYAEIFKSEAALVRSQFISGTHALSVTLFGLLRPGDLLLSISGLPYDTLHEVIGIRENPSSLKSFGIKYDQIELIDDDFDYDGIANYLKNHKVKVIEIQRSKGYSVRKSISIEKIKKVADLIHNIDKDVIIMVDNCYCEFVREIEPTQVGCDIAVGSLIKNLGGGLAPNGAYVVGKSDLISLVAERLNCPGEGALVGPSLGLNKNFLQGLFFAPEVVASALKTAVLTSKVMEKLGYDVEPRSTDMRVDIVQNIIFGNPDDLIKYCRGIQSGSPIDANALVEPSDMPGYADQVIMAAGAFVQGSSIELSCDGPIREPYIAYQQGALSYEYGRYAVKKAVESLINN